MSSTYSTNLAFELMGTGDQSGTWGNTANTNIGTLIEQAISGYVTQAITDGADTTITIPNGASGVARNMYIECTGALTANRNLVVPSNKKLYFIYNNTTGGKSVTVKVSGQTGITVPNGVKMSLACNGTDVVNAITYMNLTAVDGTPIGATTASTGAFTTLSASSTVSGAGFTSYLASPPAIGGTVPGAGSFTTLSATGTVTFSGDTVARGVALVKYKTTDNTFNTNATPSSDAQLTTGSVGVGVYAFTMFLIFSATTGSSGFKYQLGGGATFAVTGAAFNTQYVLGAAATGITTASNAQAFTANVSANIPQYALVTGVLQVTVAGTIAAQYSQNTSSAINTTCYTNSYLSLTKLS